MRSIYEHSAQCLVAIFNFCTCLFRAAHAAHDGSDERRRARSFWLSKTIHISTKPWTFPRKRKAQNPPRTTHAQFK